MAEVQTPAGASARDTALMTLSIVVLLAGLVAFYWFDEQALPIRIAMVIVGLAAAAGLMWFTWYGREFWQFVLAARIELRKVVWPERDETVKPTDEFGAVYVLAMVCGSRLFELRAQGLRVAQRAGQARRFGSQVRRNSGADRRSGGNARRSEAQVRPQILPGLCARADGNGRGHLALGQRGAEGIGLHRRHQRQAGGHHRQGSDVDPAPRGRGRGQTEAEGAVRARRSGSGNRRPVQRLQRRS